MIDARLSHCSLAALDMVGEAAAVQDLIPSELPGIEVSLPGTIEIANAEDDLQRTSVLLKHVLAFSTRCTVPIAAFSPMNDFSFQQTSSKLMSRTTLAGFETCSYLPNWILDAVCNVSAYGCCREMLNIHGLHTGHTTVGAHLLLAEIPRRLCIALGA